MSIDFCMDCGVLLSPHTSTCPVCGFDNGYDRYQEIPIEGDIFIDSFPDNSPGFNLREDL